MATSQLDVIKKFMAALDKTTLSGEKALDEAVKACSSFASAQALINKMLADQEAAGSGDKFLKNYCGIILSNTDTGAITGKDAGGSTTKTATSVVPENGTTWKYPTGTSFTKRGLTVIIPAESTIADDSIGTAENKKTIIKGLYTWWIDEGLKLIEESFGYSFNDSDATTKKITLNFVNRPTSNWLAYVDYTNVNNMSLNVNLYHYEKIDASNVNGKATAGTNMGKNNLLDRTITHELVHAIMLAKVKNYSSLPLFLREGLAELVHGIDDEKNNAIQQLADIDYIDETYNDLADFLDLKKNMSGWGYEYATGYILLRYLAKQAAETSQPSSGNTITGSAQNDSLSNTAAGKIINGLAGNDSLKNSGANVTIYGGAGNDSIYATKNASNSKIFGDAGNDTIRTEASNNSISGGDGNDYVYIYSTATKSTANGGAGNDTIRTEAASTSISGGDGNDYVYIYSTATKSTANGGDGNDTLKTEASLNSIFGGDGADYIYVYSNASNSKIDAGAGNDSIKTEASNNSISGGDGNDYIYLFNTAQNSTVNAGKGNDTIYASSLGSVFIYSSGDGNDVIHKFSSKDTLKISGSYSTTKSGNDLIYSVGSGKITLKGAASLVSSGKNLSNSKASTLLTGTSYADTISDTASKVTISVGGGNDYVYLHSKASNSKIDGGAGNDTLRSEAASTSISGGDGADYIYFYDTATKSTANGGAGNDTIKTEASNNSISGGDGNDYIQLFDTAKNSTVNGGKGNDTIYASSLGSVFVYSTGDGNDVIHNFSAKDTLKISGSYSTTKSGNDLIYSVGSGKITLKGAASLASSSANTIENYTKNKTVNGTSSAETINNYAGGAKILAGAGNDYIYSSVKQNYTVKSSYGYVTIDGGAGNDKIYNVDPNVSISGGAGNDYINHTGSSFGGVTINAGAGNDTISSNSTVGAIFQVASVDGSDVIYGFTSNDTIQTHSAMTYNWDIGGSDAKVTIGSAVLTLKNFKEVPNVIGGLPVKVTGSTSLWFTDDDNNFIGGDTRLDDISDVAADYSSGDFSATNFENLGAQKNSSVTAITASTKAST